uniref:Oligomycin sensitivity conferral protein n=1 Tax=Riptortus pedestris TaxID=329032 RepID=R4WRX9_RIPPE|nr:ATP synthase delta chain [Riptortus pedestris]
MASSQILNIVRTYASSTAKIIKPPVQVFGIEGRYASALYSAAVKLKQLDAIEKDLLSLKKTIDSDAKLRSFIDNPTIKRSLKVDAITQIAGKINLTEPSKNLLGLLAENGRLGKIDNVVNAFSTIMAGHRGDLRCEVVTAKALDEETKKQLQTVLKGFAKKGENIILELKVDPNIIGGMIVSVGDNYVDMSVASKIKKYTDLITEAV